MSGQGRADAAAGFPQIETRVLASLPKPSEGAVSLNSAPNLSLL